MPLVDQLSSALVLRLWTCLANIIHAVAHLHSVTTRPIITITAKVAAHSHLSVSANRLLVLATACVLMATSTCPSVLLVLAMPIAILDMHVQATKTLLPPLQMEVAVTQHASPRPTACPATRLANGVSSLEATPLVCLGFSPGKAGPRHGARLPIRPYAGWSTMAWCRLQRMTV